eukprot:PITA_17474
MSREKDFAWAYCDKILGDPKLLCKFCKAKCSGGIYRFKYHLAQIPGHDIVLFKNIDENVKHQETLSIDMLSQHNAKKEKQKKEIGTPRVDNFSSTTPLSCPSIESSMQFPSFPHMPPSPSQTQGQMNPPAFNIGGGNINIFFSPRTKPGSQPTLDTTGWKKNIHSQARKAIANFWYYSNIPFHCAISPYWKAMIDAVAIFHSSWVETGCTIMSDGWIDQRNRTLINLLVSCPVGTMFLKSVAASEKVKNAQLICKMMEEVIQEVGEERVVQIVTDNVANYMVAGRLFEIRHPTIFWTYCVAHCIDLMLEDIGKLHWIHQVVDKEKSITKYLYNHIIVLNTMRKYTEGKEIVRPAMTRFATNFISLQFVVEQKINLKRMSLGPEWMASKHSKTLEGIEVVALMFNDGFWKDVEDIIVVMESLVRVLRMVDGDKPTMGYIYEVMDLTKEAIKRGYGDEEAKYMPLWDIIDAHWEVNCIPPYMLLGTS